MGGCASKKVAEAPQVVPAAAPAAQAKIPEDQKTAPEEPASQGVILSEAPCQTVCCGWEDARATAPPAPAEEPAVVDVAEAATEIAPAEANPPAKEIEASAPVREEMTAAADEVETAAPAKKPAQGTRSIGGIHMIISDMTQCLRKGALEEEAAAAAAEAAEAEAAAAAAGEAAAGAQTAAADQQGNAASEASVRRSRSSGNGKTSSWFPTGCCSGGDDGWFPKAGKRSGKDGDITIPNWDWTWNMDCEDMDCCDCCRNEPVDKATEIVVEAGAEKAPLVPNNTLDLKDGSR